VVLGCAVLLGAALLCCAEDGKLPDESRVAYQSAFPQKGALRLPSFMDVFASFSQQDYINVGLKWKVTESKAAMAYAVRSSTGHKPIAKQTDDFHIEAFAKAEKPAPADFVKMRFRQKGVYSGSIGYAAPDKTKEGVFVLWDAKKKDHARLQLGSLRVEKAADLAATLHVKKAITTDADITTKKSSKFAGTTIGDGPLGARLEAPAGSGFALYTVPKGGKADPKQPPVFVSDTGFVGLGTTKPAAYLQVKSADKKVAALNIEDGSLIVGGKSLVSVNGEAAGKPVEGMRLAVLTNGNTGINAPKPEEKLHVGGAVKIDSAGKLGPSKATLFVDNTLTKCSEHSVRVKTHFYVSACGKVGVKTPTPLADFHVTGKTKTTTLDVDKDVKVAGTTTLNVLTPLKGKLGANTLEIIKEGVFRDQVKIEKDLVVKGNLYVEKEVKMIGGGGASEEMNEMLMSRLSLIEESHSSLKSNNEKLHARVKELEEQLSRR
jgi:hypothetical protein